MYDVLAVNAKTRKVRIISWACPKDRAEARVDSEIARRGVNRGANGEFFVVAVHGTYQDGKKWEGR